MIARVSLLLVLGLSLAHAQEAGSVTDYVQNGNLNYARGDCQFAQYFFQEALKLEPSNLDAALGKGKALVCQGAYDAGITEFENVLNASPNNVAARVQLAQAYQKQYDSDRQRYGSRLDDALNLVQTTELLGADNAELLNVKGVVLAQLGDTAGAREALERAITLYSNMSAEDQAITQINLGKVYLQLDERESALQAFKRAVALNPASASAHNNVGATYFALGDCDQGIYELSQAVNLNPSSLDATFNLGRAKFDCGQVDSSIPHFEAALNLQGNLNIPQLYTYLSRAYASVGRYDDAVLRAQQGALLPPNSAEAYFYLGQAFEARGGANDANNACDAYQTALDLEPTYQPALDAAAACTTN